MQDIGEANKKSQELKDQLEKLKLEIDTLKEEIRET
jgi:hypothetical protein